MRRKSVWKLNAWSFLRNLTFFFVLTPNRGPLGKGFVSRNGCNFEDSGDNASFLGLNYISRLRVFNIEPQCNHFKQRGHVAQGSKEKWIYIATTSPTVAEFNPEESIQFWKQVSVSTENFCFLDYFKNSLHIFCEPERDAESHQDD